MKAPMQIRKVVLVAGYDYSPLMTGQQEISFVKLCLNRATLLCHVQAIARRTGRAPQTLEFTLFDVKRGRVLTKTSGDRGPWKPVSAHQPVTLANYIPGSRGRMVFGRNPEGVLAITDVYHYLQMTGKNDPGSVLELSIFSHGWRGVVFLVNSE